MQTIVLLSDFSDNAANAIDYAIHLSQDSFGPDNCRFVLLHAYQYDYMYAPAGRMAPVGSPEAPQELWEELEEEAGQLRQKYPGIALEPRLEGGLLIDALNVAALEEQPDLLVVGSRGAGSNGGQILGSTAAAIVKKTTCPTLVVPAGVVFSRPRRVVFATDFERLDNLNVLNPLLAMVRAFDPHFLCLHVLSAGDTPDAEKERMNRILRYYFDSLKYSHHYLEHEDPGAGIEAFIRNHQVDLLVLIDRPRRFFESLFHRSVIKKLTFHTQVPLLVLKN